MKLIKGLAQKMSMLALTLTALPGLTADYPAPREGSWVARDFRFHTGEVLPELRLHYTTVGSPTGEPVLILHGTTGSGASMLTPAFAGELFGAGQPLDSSRYRTPSARASRASLRTVCTRAFRSTTTTTWWTPSTG